MKKLNIIIMQKKITFSFFKYLHVILIKIYIILYY